MGKYGMNIPEPITYRPAISGIFFPSRNEQPILTPLPPKRPVDHPSFSQPHRQQHSSLSQHTQPSHSSTNKHSLSRLVSPPALTHTSIHHSLSTHTITSPKIYKKAPTTKHVTWLPFFTYQTVFHPGYYENHTRQKVRFVLKTGGLLGLAFCLDRMATLVFEGVDNFTLFEILVLLVLSSVLLFTVEHFDLVIARENPYQVRER